MMSRMYNVEVSTAVMELRYWIDQLESARSMLNNGHSVAHLVGHYLNNVTYWAADLNESF